MNRNIYQWPIYYFFLGGRSEEDGVAGSFMLVFPIHGERKHKQTSKQ
jgi:hypothetical protein